MWCDDIGGVCGSGCGVGGLVYYQGVRTAEGESHCDHPPIRDATSLLPISITSARQRNEWPKFPKGAINNLTSLHHAFKETFKKINSKFGP